ncbi:integrase [Lysinibacillus sphaericus]|uniref:site-specific integrase n=1 Tax=Lysinibacillus sphaericus TaxID=1421 RepID=UPI0018CCF741|nr:site-specific integrase [Lysinibacillus sphaericus]MBG9691376.1 integrase [Lysinibacillus sphaericus]
MATIQSYELKNGQKRYMFQLYIGVDPLTGKEQRTTRRGFKTKKEAELTLARLKLEIDKGNYKKESLETFQEVYELWINQYENTVEESTFNKTINYFKNHILPTLGKYKIEKINVALCQNIVNEWFKNYSEYRIFKSYAARIFDFAIKHDFILNNPMKLVEVPRKIDVPTEEENENFYTREELIHFLNCAKDYGNYQAFTFFRLLAFSGSRKSELLALTWNDIDFTKNEVRINKALARGKNSRLYIKTTKTKKSTRTIKMDVNTMAILDEWKKRQKHDYFKLGYNTLKPNQLIFSSRKNELLQTSGVNQWMNQIIDKYSLKKITVHGWRHTCASLLFEAGSSLKEVQDRLGHNDVKTTMDIYTHVTEKAKSEAIQKLASYLNI